MSASMNKKRLKKPSATQVRALQSIAVHGNPGFHVFGQSAHGGANGTQRSIIQRGWARCTPSGGWCLTQAGKELIHGSSCCG